LQQRRVVSLTIEGANVRDAGEKKADAIESKKSMSNDHATSMARSLDDSSIHSPLKTPRRGKGGRRALATQATTPRPAAATASSAARRHVVYHSITKLLQ
jgi:hypothetical protein